jgi:NAD(P)H-flavin reductase/ferredoxin
MAKTHKILVNGESFSATRGDTLLDAALLAGVNLPHDCRAGRCGSCAVNLVEGHVLGGENGEPGMVLACQCRIISDAEFIVEEVPDILVQSARIASMMPVASDVVELRIKPAKPIPYLPGQYFRVKFRGFPERCYSPTVPMDRSGDGVSFHLHIRRLPGGRVSQALGRQILKGHAVTITGPFGTAFLREQLTNRLVLVATGTGFAPIWSIATAAITENPERQIVVVVGGKTIESLYMVRALRRLSYYPNVKIIPVASTPQSISKTVRLGRTTDHMPPLSEHDIVYVCGAPPMVDAVREIANAAGAMCYADPFEPQTGNDGEGLLSRAISWIKGDNSAQQQDFGADSPSRQIAIRDQTLAASRRFNTNGGAFVRMRGGADMQRPADMPADAKN